MASTKAATRRRSYDWDSRGIALISLTASWETVAAPASWRNLIDQARMNRGKDGPSGVPSASAVGLSDPPRTGGLVVTVSVHAHDEPRSTERDAQLTETHWSLEVYRAPSATAPDIITEGSARVGGSKGLLASLYQNWPHAQPLRFSVSASYMVDGSKFTTSDLIQQARPKILRPAGGVKLRASATIWELQRKDERALATVGYQDNGVIGPIPINWRGTVQQSLTNDIVSQLDAMVWEKLQIAVQPKARVVRGQRAGGRQ